MTAPMDNDDFPPHLRHFEQICKAAGLKLTHQRLEIYRELLEARDHPSAETLHKRLDARLPTLSLDTVYRTLTTFERLGLAHRLETRESQARFEALSQRHHHFLCDRCGQVVDFTWPGFDMLALPPALTGIGTIHRTSAVIYGQCAACLAREQNPTTR